MDQNLAELLKEIDAPAIVQFIIHIPPKASIFRAKGIKNAIFVIREDNDGVRRIEGVRCDDGDVGVVLRTFETAFRLFGENSPPTHTKNVTTPASWIAS
jgi:hypothetical protein